MIKKIVYRLTALNFFLVVSVTFASEDSQGMAMDPDSRLKQFHPEFVNSVKNLVSIKNPDWVSLESYHPPAKVNFLAPF